MVSLLTDENLFIETQLKVQDKLAQTVPLVFNEEQAKLRDKIQELERAGLPVRIIILKARQIGFTTAISAMLYYRTVTQNNQNSIVVAQKTDSANGILSKHKFFYEESPPLFQPLLKGSNAREMLFENPTMDMAKRKENPGLRSKIKIGTAGDSGLGRSQTIHQLHLSEMAFWPEEKAEEAFASVMQAVPNQPGTMVVIESTANGIGGVFYREWQRAVNGESSFVPLFFPWYEHAEYTMPVPKDFAPDEEEKRLMETYGITAGQIVWRRWCIYNNCRGDVKVFHQEYPTTAEEAFISSGRSVFDASALAKAQMEAKDPPAKRIGNMGEVASGSESRAVFQAQYNGPLKVWEPPKDGEEYMIGVDVSLGKEGGDYSCMQVINRRTLAQVACWHGLVDPDELGRLAVLLAKWYQGAWIAPEANSFGQMTIKTMRSLHYPRICRSRQENKTEDHTGNTYGIMTTVKSKPLMIGALQQYIRTDAERIKDEATIRECLTYVVGDDNRSTNAQSGCHDDRVMALALAIYATTTRRYVDSGGSGKQVVVEDWAAIYGSNKTTGY